MAFDSLGLRATLQTELRTKTHVRSEPHASHAAQSPAGFICLAFTLGSAGNALSAPTPINAYCGTWTLGISYALGNVVT
jgi:hypothetical protein